MLENECFHWSYLYHNETKHYEQLLWIFPSIWLKCCCPSICIIILTYCRPVQNAGLILAKKNKKSECSIFTWYQTFGSAYFLSKTLLSVFTLMLFWGVNYNHFVAPTTDGPQSSNICNNISKFNITYGHRNKCNIITKWAI